MEGQEGTTILNLLRSGGDPSRSRQIMEKVWPVLPENIILCEEQSPTGRFHSHTPPAIHPCKLQGALALPPEPAFEVEKGCRKNPSPYTN